MNKYPNKEINATDIRHADPELYIKAVVRGADIDAAERMAKFASTCGFGTFKFTGEAAECFLGTLKKKV